MPGFVKSPEDEKKWSRAKAIRAKDTGKSQDSFQDKDWAIVTTIFKNMDKSEMNLAENIVSQFEADTIHFGKGDTIPPKLINFKGDYKSNLYVVIDRSSKSNQDAYGMYLTDKKLKVIYSFGSHPARSTEVPPDSQLKKMIDGAKYLGE